ncbi:MAG TPA: hypothetical protein VFW35_08205 [Sphingomicrobium sp.]|nr:hypothetical protein [Sphingomicrobium sp.]
MTAKKSQLRGDKTEGERRKHLSDGQVKDLELAGGVEGGMQAGSAGGPGEKDDSAGSRPDSNPQD